MPALAALGALSQRILYVAYVGDTPERGLAGSLAGARREGTLGAHVSTLDNYKVAPFASAAICCTVCRRVAAMRGRQTVALAKS